MIKEIGYCHGIENYSRHLSGRAPGEPPPTLLDYLPADAIIIVDESHQTVPQVRGMYAGDRSRKEVLVEYGFRLPSALDNRPLNFAEWEARVGQVDLRERDARAVRAAPGRRRHCRADHPADRPGRSRHRRAAGEGADRRPAGRDSRRGGARRARAGDDPHQAHGGRSDAVLPGARRARAVPPFGHRHARARADPPRPAPRRLRRAGRHQPAAGRPRPAGSVARGDPRRRQGRVSCGRRAR